MKLVTFFLMLSFSSRVTAFTPIASTLKNTCRRAFQSSRLSMSTAVKITTYNVLSSHLGGADYFTSCKPADLDANYRLEVLKKKLDLEIESKAIICLQEVSTPWAGFLHAYFANRGYHMITGLYGNKFNG
jgi:mRNA deadenylase 3'-5' endonuclease subunit Ccr4